METSDSECFESADEEFQSDEDTSTITSSTKSEDVQVKNVEKDVEIIQNTLSDTKLCDTSDVIKSDLNKNESINKNNDTVKKLGKNLASDDNQNKIVSNNKDNKSSTEKLEHESVKTLDKPVKNKTKSSLGTSSKSTKKIDLPVLNSNITTKKSSDLKTNVFEEDLWGNDDATWTNEEQKDIRSSQKNEENMWDDDEIDWGEKYIRTKESVSKPHSNNIQNRTEVKDIKSDSRIVQEEDDLWGDDDWESLDKGTSEVIKQVPQTAIKNDDNNSNSGWSSWGNWNVTSILTTASQSVSTLTNHVSHGLNTVLESGIGVPDPEEMARINALERQKFKELSKDETDVKEIPENDEINEKQGRYGFGLGNIVSGVNQFTKLVESTGTKVISGGLDTLETIGKKTMEVLQEGDPGLKKKRAFLKIDQDKPVLSQLLREAKEKHETEIKQLEQKHYTIKIKNYETLFDDHQGLVHLEALEMLSKQCDIKLQTLLESNVGEALTDMQETLEQVKELCELPDEDEDEQMTVVEVKEKLESAIAEIGIPITYKQLLSNWEETELWMNNLNIEICSERELHQQAIETLAQLTAIAVEQFHKSGELLLVKDHRSTADEADSLVQLTSTLTSFIGIVAAKFSDKLNTKAANITNKEDINGLITNVFFEAANSSSYIQDAFQLLIPVLQVGAV